MKNKSLLISLLLGLLVAFVVYYVFLPVINPSAFSFWAYVIFLILDFWFFSSFGSLFKNEVKLTKRLRDIPKITLLSMLSIILIICTTTVINFIVSPIFNAKSYSRRIEIDQNGVFTDDVSEAQFNKIPLLDKDSSQKLGDRTMGQYSDYVSQFYVSNEYTQINYNDDIVRVTPLEYDGFIKWLTNKEDGIGAYITVNSVDGEASLVKLNEGMKYLKSAFFSKNLYRKLRFSYPFTIMGESKFEIDNDGKPYYITPTLAYSGVGQKTRVTGAIITDPVNGESTKYKLEDVPSWVDNVYPASLVIEQVNDWGTYRGGFINSIFGQKNVVNTTEGYNYLALNDDIYLYTGITSVLTDESNLGFILTNLRTGKTVYYDVPGAEEYSAMESAKGQVQQMNYTSTFPLLINLSGRPTYLVSLKDKAGLVKMYAFIDVKDYQKVVVTDSSLGINKAAENYLSVNTAENNTVEFNSIIEIKKISNAVKDGNTYYYIVDTQDKKYVVDIKVSDYLPFLNAGDKIDVYYNTNASIIKILRLNIEGE